MFARILNSVSRLMSRFVLFFSSKYGPIQRLFRALIFEFKIARRAFKQESKRYNEEMLARKLADTFSNIAEVDTEVLSESANAETLEDSGTDAGPVGLKDVRSVDSDDEEIRISNERMEEFFKAIGVYDDPDEDEKLLDAEYKKHLEYYLGIVSNENVLLRRV